MTKWFEKRYISREEHQEIVEYYRRLVASLQHTIVDFQVKVDAQNIDSMVDLKNFWEERELRKLAERDELGDNVIHMDFRRH